MSPEAIQTIDYSAGKENGYKENLRDWFKMIYEVIFGDKNGPRLGFFISYYGVKETIDFIKIDAEGAELEILEGGLKELRRSQPFMIIDHDFSANDLQLQKSCQ